MQNADAFWVVLSHPGASAFLLGATGVLSQDKLLTNVNALIAAVRNSEPLRDISKEMTPGVGATGVTLGLDTLLGGWGGVQLAFVIELRIQSSALM